MTFPRPMRMVFSLVAAAALSCSLLACEVGDETCCVGHVRGCVDELDLCSWQCGEQSAGADCYADCIDVVGECSMTCKDQ